MEAKVQVPTPTQSDISEPSKPGTSMKYLGGKPFRNYLLWLTLANLFITIIWGSVASILLPNQVQSIEFSRWFTGDDANVNLTELTNLKNAIASGNATATNEQTRLLDLLDNFDASRASSLSLISAIGVFGTMLVQPIIGVFSDRTRSRFGRRAPWILFGAIAGILFLIGVRYSPTILILTITWTLAQIVYNMASGPLQASVADRVPESKMGTVSSLGGLGNILGGVLGGVGVGILFQSLGLSLYIIIGVLVAVGLIGFVMKAPDNSSLELEVKPYSWGGFFKGLIVPLRDRDFFYVWIARIVLMFGYSASTALSLYMMQSYIKPALSITEATQLAPLLAIAGLPLMLVAIMISGKLSDKVGKRKPFVIVASITMAVGMAVPLLLPTLPALFIQAVLGGIAMGIYLPVDQALFIDVLPNKDDDAGRDLGIAAVATNFGQALGPILAGQIVAIFASYGMIWAVSMVLALVAALIILPVKGVK
jgi:MFS family permease